MNRRELATFALTLSMSNLGTAWGSDYPTGPVTQVVPYAAGGTTDLLARIIAKNLSTRLPGNYIVENRVGAGGNIAASYVARAKPNGLTLLMSSVGQFAINPLIFSEPGYDSTKDFVPIIAVADVPNILITLPKTDIYTIKDLLGRAKQKPGILTFASSGNGSSNHLAGVMFTKLGGVDMLHVPYKGSAPGLQALYSGDVDVMFDNLSSALPHIKSGKLRAIAVTSSARVPQLPSVPTIAESGLHEYAASAWFGLVAPRGTPNSIVATLNQVINSILEDASVKQQLVDMGVTPLGGSLTDFAKLIATDTTRWAPVVKSANLTVN